MKKHVDFSIEKNQMFNCELQNKDINGMVVFRKSDSGLNSWWEAYSMN